MRYSEPDNEEIILGGGRTAKGVVKIGNTVRKPVNKNSEYSRQVLQFLEKKHFNYSQRYLGKDEQNREIYAYIEGYVPEDLGDTTDTQLHSFMKMVREFHDVSRDFVKSNTLVLCHDDLSPCNVVFRDNHPIAIIDWKDVHPDERWQDLTYILWLWINIGSHRENKNIVSQMSSALNAYGADDTTKHDFANKLIKRMNRVLTETDKSRRDYEKIKEWVQYSIQWVEKNRKNIQTEIG
jgi:thiamine kinase-like enzyme